MSKWHEHDRASRHALHDARGIFLTYVCDECEARKRREFRVDVFHDPQYWADEPIDDAT